MTTGLLFPSTHTSQEIPRTVGHEAPLGSLLSLVAIAGLAVSVWLGGVLVYEERVGVAEDVPRLPRTPLPGPGMR